MASSKQGMQIKPLQNYEEIVEFMLETDDELSDLSDSDFEDIMDVTDVSSDEELLSDMNENIKEPPQPDPDTRSLLSKAVMRSKFLKLSSLMKL